MGIVEKIAKNRPKFGNPAAFNSNIAQSFWESFTVTLKDPTFFDQMIQFSGNQPGTGGLVTFKDSNWFMSIVLHHQPHFLNQPEGVQLFWGYALSPDRIGNFVAKPMSDCTGEEILQGAMRTLALRILQPSREQTAYRVECPISRAVMFMPRNNSDRPLPVPKESKNLAFISQFVEIPDDVVFTVEYSIRAAQIAVYQLLGIDRLIPPVTPHDKSIRVQFEALVKSFEIGAFDGLPEARQKASGLKISCKCYGSTQT